MTRRSSWQGVLNIVRFNWDFYVFGLVAFLIGCGVLLWLPLPDILRVLGVVALVAGAYLVLGSLFASWYVYDFAPMYGFAWLPGFAGAAKRVLNIHAGFDESSQKLRAVYKDAKLEIADFYDPEHNTEKSIARARQAYPALPETRTVDPRALPYQDDQFDLACALFAAHEIREPLERIAFFKELLRVANSVVLLEHLRDAPNFIVYGPGALHFYGEAQWQRTVEAAGWRIAARTRLTPFVMAFRLERGSS